MTTINTDIYNALMAGVNSTITDMPLAWENVGETPTLPTAFCRVDMLPHSVEPASLGLEGYNEHRGTLLLTLHYPLGQGSAAAVTKIDSIASTLKRGVTLSSGSALVRIESVWRQPAAYDKAWAKFPIQLRWRCHAES